MFYVVTTLQIDGLDPYFFSLRGPYDDWGLAAETIHYTERKDNRFVARKRGRTYVSLIVIASAECQE